MMGRRKKSGNKNQKIINNETEKGNYTENCDQLKTEDDSLDEMDELLSEEGPDIKYTGKGR